MYFLSHVPVCLLTLECSCPQEWRARPGPPTQRMKSSGGTGSSQWCLWRMASSVWIILSSTPPLKSPRLLTVSKSKKKTWSSLHSWIVLLRRKAEENRVVHLTVLILQERRTNSLLNSRRSARGRKAFHQEPWERAPVTQRRLSVLETSWKFKK